MKKKIKNPFLMIGPYIGAVISYMIAPYLWVYGGDTIYFAGITANQFWTTIFGFISGWIAQSVYEQ